MKKKLKRLIPVWAALSCALAATAGEAATALSFNGTSQYVTTGPATASLGASNLTLELWFRRTGAGATTSTGSGGVTAVPLVAKGRGEVDGDNRDCNYFFGITAAGQLVADFEAAPAAGITTGQNYPVTASHAAIQNDVWYHAAATYDVAAHTWKVYLNGALVGSSTPPAGAAPRADSIQHFAIGSALTSTGAAAGFFAGVIDEVRIWNAARTESQIVAGMAKEAPASTTGLIGRYAFNEGTGPTTASAVAGGPVGTLTPAATPPAWVPGHPFGPSVVITAPADGASVFAPGAFTVEAAISNDDGTIGSAELLRDGVVVGTDTAAPFSFTETGLAAGRYTYVARATDGLGDTITSTGVSVNVVFDPTSHPANTALRFDGVDDHVAMGTAPQLNAGGPPRNGFTLECWFRKEGAGVLSSSGNGGVTGVPLFGKGRGESENSNVDANYFFGINTGGQLVADFEAYPAPGITAGQNYPVTGSHAPITNGVWHHAAVTYDGVTATWALYLDGAPAGSATAAAGAGPRFDSIQHFGIGAAVNSTGVAEGAFAGRIDEVRVWSHARSAAEIAAGRDYEIGDAPGLIGRYGLNEAAGTAAGNSAGLAGAPVGTLANGPLWVEGAPFAVANLAPHVTLDAPVNGATSEYPVAVPFAVTASDADGAVASVELYIGSTRVAELSAAPFTFNWTPPAVGTYVVSARARDDVGAVTTTVGATLTITPSTNQAPTITPVSPVDRATGVGSPASLQVTLSDPENDATTVTFFGRKTTPLLPGPDFTLIAIPDTQFYSENIGRNPSTGGTGAIASLFEAQTQWIVDNRISRNVAFASHMGDIVQNGDKGGDPREWINADRAMKTIEDQLKTLTAFGIPWGGAPGNHDYGPSGNGSGTTTFYNQYFGSNRWLGRPYYGGHFGSDNNNNYELWSASGLDFISIHLAYNAGAVSGYQAVLDWADALLKAYPNRRATVTSHWIVNTGNPASFGPQGQAIYDQLKDNPNLFLLMCGHVHGEGRRVDVFQGRTVYSVLQDYQDSFNGGNGFLRLYTFSPSTNKIRVESYSPVLGRAVNASDNVNSWTGPFELSYDMQAAIGEWTVLGTVQVPAGGTQAAFSWAGLEGGATYEWYAAVSDGISTATTPVRRFATTPASAPTIALTAPADGAVIPGPANVELAAAAADADGTVTRVEFYNGNTKLGTVATAPFRFSWTGAPLGTHTLTAVAVDDSGRATLSNIVRITVVDSNLRPVVAITSPAAGAVFDAPAAIPVDVSASDPDGSVVKVELYSGATKVAEDTAAPFQLSWTGVFTGAHSLRAVATDDDGGITTSSAVDIVVNNLDNLAPTVALTAPASGTRVFTGSALALVASAADGDGMVSRVEFYAGATRLGEAPGAPYRFDWLNVPAGNHVLTAVATDNDGGTATSAGIDISVVAPPPGTFTFFEDFNAMGMGTVAPAGWSFKMGNSGSSNSTWTTTITANGGNSVAAMVNTTGAMTVTNAPTSTNNNGFNAAVPGDAANRLLATSPTSINGTAIQLALTNDSGGFVSRLRIGYDIYRLTAPATANELPGFWLFYSLDHGASWSNAAALNPTLAGPGRVVVPNTTGLTRVSPTLVTLGAPWSPGATLLLRWVDDNAVATSPDQILGLDNVSVATPARPTVELTAPPSGAAFTAPAVIDIAATATDADGSIVRVEFLADGTRIGEDTTAPYAFQWSGVAAGVYMLTARATDDDGDQASSAEVAAVVNVPRFILALGVTGEGRVAFAAGSSIGTCPAACAPSFDQGTAVTVTAVPAAGWDIAGWGGACAGTGTCTVVVNADTNVTATFVLKRYTITANVTGGGTVTPAGTDVDHGRAATFSLTADAGHDLATLTDNGVPATAVSTGRGSYTYTIPSVTEPHELHATFRRATPTADAGADVAIHAGSRVALDGSGSSDPLERSLAYAWRLTVIPSGSTASLESANTVRPSLRADRPGDYTAELVVSNTHGFVSAADVVVIHSTNAVPVASAGPDQIVSAGATVRLGGGGSTDADGDVLTYSWRLESKPSGSRAQIAAPGARETAFTADKTGLYVVRLAVRDGFAESAGSRLHVLALAPQIEIVRDLITVIARVAGMGSADFKGKNTKAQLLERLEVILARVLRGDYRGALQKLKQDVLPRVDGCAGDGNGTADQDDWLTCRGQAQIHAELTRVAELLKSLK